MKCPICGKPTLWKDNPTRPFCSEACQTRDLGNWLTQRYAVPSEATPDFMADPFSESRHDDEDFTAER
jgi:hypothetical protein